MKNTHIILTGSNNTSPDNSSVNNSAAQELAEELLLKQQLLEEQARVAELKLKLLEAEQANQMNMGGHPVPTVKQPVSRQIDLIDIDSDREFLNVAGMAGSTRAIFFMACAKS